MRLYGVPNESQGSIQCCVLVCLLIFILVTFFIATAKMVIAFAKGRACRPPCSGRLEAIMKSLEIDHCDRGDSSAFARVKGG